MSLATPDDRPAPVVPIDAARTSDDGSPSARIAADLLVRARAIAKAAARVRSGHDETAVHDLRVALRRLNAALRLWEDLLAPGPARAARRRIRRMRLALGPLRELEADAQHLLNHRRALPVASRVAAEALLGDLFRRIEKAMRRARPAVRPAAARAIRRRVERAVAGIEARLADLGDPAALARPRVDAAREDAARRLGGALEAGTDDHLHEARVALKKWRYALEAIPDSVDSTQPMAALRELQEALGRAHDCAMLHERVERRSGKLGERGLSAQSAALIPLLERLEAERRHFVDEARGLAPRLESLATPH